MGKNKLSLKRDFQQIWWQSGKTGKSLYYRSGKNKNKRFVES